MSQNEMTTAEVLNRAADLIEERGWHQGDYQSKGADNVCALGGINLATTGVSIICNEAGLLAQEAMEHYLGLIPVAVYNDNEGRTATEVIEALRACAVIAESRETSAVASTHHAGLPGAEVGAK